MPTHMHSSHEGISHNVAQPEAKLAGLPDRPRQLPTFCTKRPASGAVARATEIGVAQESGQIHRNRKSRTGVGLEEELLESE